MFYFTDERVEFDWEVGPDYEGDAVRLTTDFPTGFELSQKGALVLTSQSAVVSISQPIATELINGKRIPVPSSFRKVAHNEIVVDVRSHAGHRIVIDPVISYSTYLPVSPGASRYATGIAVDSTGAAYIVGYRTKAGSSSDADIFVFKFDPTGSQLLYNIGIVGLHANKGMAIALDINKNAYITGSTSSTDFPLVTPFQANLKGASNAFVIKLGPSGTLVFSSYFGGTGIDEGHAIGVDSAQNIYIAGVTGSRDLPVANAIQATCKGCNPTFPTNPDGFVTKFVPTGASLVYSTYMGGDRNDNITGIAVDPSGNAYVAGTTDSVNFPILNPYQSQCAGKFHSGGTGVYYCSYLGGTGVDSALAIAADAQWSRLRHWHNIVGSFPDDPASVFADGSSKLWCL